MGAVWNWITGGVRFFFSLFKTLAAGIVGKILGAFGLTVVTFEAILPNIKEFVLQYVSMIPPQAMELLQALGIGQAMSMILSALAVRMAWKVFVIPTSVANSIGGGA